MNRPPKTDSAYSLSGDGSFEIGDYNRSKTFCNFLPGIAGLKGTPMWVFTVNRGQGIASFGVGSKDQAFLEFFPANKALQNVTTLGFRTFLKGRRGAKSFQHEPFRRPSPKQTMRVRAHELSIEERDEVHGLETSVVHFTIPGEPLAVLARQVTVRNLDRKPLDLEFLDGLPQVTPYGMNEFFIKQMSRTIEAWMVVDNVERKAPYYRLRVDATDRPEVVRIEAGNFFFGSVEPAPGRWRPLEPVVDPERVFGSVQDYGVPERFLEASPYTAGAQVLENRTPCAMGYARVSLAAGRAVRWVSYFGHAPSLPELNRYVQRSRKGGYVEAKRQENRLLIESLQSPCFTATDEPAYDSYCAQAYLDNLLRGGRPIRLGGTGPVFHVYSRKHGDLERDYNRFLVEPTYFSQGNGNFRDVNQNRRNDPWFDPQVGDLNIRTFYNFLQPDGFNPLVLKGSRFRLAPSALRSLRGVLTPRQASALNAFIRKPFAPGELCRACETLGISGGRFDRLLARLAPRLEREDLAEHGEGYWIDHWTYNLDHLESYLSIFPERGDRLLWGDRSFTFHDSDHVVRPRDAKHQLHEGRVRQYGSVVLDKEKARLIASRAQTPHLVRTRHGKGSVYRTTLMAKLVCLALNKLASVDPHGSGIEMEADKPGWCDALNGLPGLLGSSSCELYELKRLADFIEEAAAEADGRSVRLPEELDELLRALDRLLSARPILDAHRYWDAATAAKERYRAATRLGFSGREKVLRSTELRAFFARAKERLAVMIERLSDPATSLVPTYFHADARSYRPLKRDGKVVTVRAAGFRRVTLPHYLEGPVHAMKIERDPARRRRLAAAVRSSALFDRKLLMYKVNAPLASAPVEIGRARIFSPGWLENESVFLHMEYKWLLELLRAGLAEEFFRDFRNVLIPFQDPERYGRSPLEHSSFIASSAFSDPSQHGRGFVARLSGSTAEFLTMWLWMNLGRRPFAIGPSGRLVLRFEPTLPAFLFTRRESVRRYVDHRLVERTFRLPEHSLAFLLFGRTLVTYHNPKRLDTYGRSRAVVRRVRLTAKGRSVDFRSDTVPSPHAERVRDGLVERIDIELG